MPPVSVPHTFANDDGSRTQFIDADQVNENFAALVAALNGGLDHSNLATLAGVLLTQLARGASGGAMGAFQVYDNSGSSYGGAGVQIAFATEIFDVSGWFDPSAHRYTPQQAAIYRLHATLKVESAVDQGYYSLKVRKNGVVLFEGTPKRASGGSDSFDVDGLVQANGTTDYFDVVLENNNGASVVSSAFFEGHLIGLT